MTEKLLIVEDDTRLAEMVSDYLGTFGYDTTIVGTGAEAISEHDRQTYDAMILDLGLPDIDGLELCRSLRTKSNIPILMLTAKGDLMDRIVGLEMGADDYLAKPFEPRELLARLRAILRRQKDPVVGDTLRFGRLEIHPNAMMAQLDGKTCTLTGHQFKLLEALAKAPGRVLSRDYLMDALKGENLEAFDRSIDVHISRIRAEIEDDPKAPRRVITVRGAGYVFTKEQD